MLEDTLQENDSEDDEDTEIKTPEQEVEEKVALVEEATICLLYTSTAHHTKPFRGVSVRN